MPKRPKKGGDAVAKTIQPMDAVDTAYTVYRTVRTILAVPALVVFVLIPGILVGILALFQPKMLKVSTGTPLTQVGDYESPPQTERSMLPRTIGWWAQ